MILTIFSLRCFHDRLSPRSKLIVPQDRAHKHICTIGASFRRAILPRIMAYTVSAWREDHACR